MNTNLAVQLRETLSHMMPCQVIFTSTFYLTLQHYCLPPRPDPQDKKGFSQSCLAARVQHN